MVTPPTPLHPWAQPPSPGRRQRPCIQLDAGITWPIRAVDLDCDRRGSTDNSGAGDFWGTAGTVRWGFAFVEPIQ